MENIVKYQLSLFMFKWAKYFVEPPRNLKLHKILCDYGDYIIRQNCIVEIACVVKYPTTNEYKGTIVCTFTFFASGNSFIPAFNVGFQSYLLFHL